MNNIQPWERPSHTRAAYRYCRDVLKIIGMVPELAQKTGKPINVVAKDAIGLRAHHGFTPKEIATNGILASDNPSVTASRKISKRSLMDLQIQLNPSALFPIIDHKAVFELTMRDKGVPVVPSLAVFFSGFAGRVVTGAVPQGRAQWLQALEPTLPKEFIVKPAEGGHGDGLRFYRKHEASLECMVTGKRIGLGELLDELDADRYYRSYIFQERLRNDPEIQYFTGSKALETLRVVTLLDRYGMPQILVGRMRLSSQGSFTDNFLAGQGGSVACVVDMESGRVLSPWSMSTHGTYSRIEKHPSTGRSLTDLQLPHWTTLKEIVDRAARAMSPLRTIGWDIAFSDKGIFIVEANSRWDPPNECDQIAWMIKKLRDEVLSSEF